ncbi:MAG: ABC transporter permease [Nitrososphaerota archaeon]
MSSIYTAVIWSWQGRVSLALLLTMLAISLYVVANYPMDYGSRIWNNPSYWAEYPKAAPPSWTPTQNVFPHTVISFKNPILREDTYIVYEETLRFDFEEPPSGITLKVGRVVFYREPPTIEAYLARPDGIELPLMILTPPGARPSEQPPYFRYSDQPLKYFPATSRSAQALLAERLSASYGIRISEGEISQRFEKYIFSRPRIDGALEPLKGDYVFRMVVTRSEETDGVEDVSVVLAGTVFGMMGTDTLGRDIAQGLLFGFPVSLSIGLLAAGVTTLLGTSLGMISGYVGGRTDHIIQRAADVTANIPLLPILILLAYTYRPGLILIILLLTLFSWPGLTILVRSMVLQLRNTQLIDAAKSIGATNLRIITRYIAPQVAPYVLGQMILSIPAAILAEAGLSFLGLGDPQIPSWGNILEKAFRTGAIFVGYWWWVIPPGLLIGLTSISFILLALSLEPAINPRLATRRRQTG